MSDEYGVIFFILCFSVLGENGTTGESLSRLVHLCLGQPLDKSDQFSNWERRPLRESQMLYAGKYVFIIK